MGIDIYIGEHGEYQIPADVMSKARDLNGAKRLFDRRTKGSKFLEHWGRTQDSNARLSGWLDEVIAKQGKAS